MKQHQLTIHKIEQPHTLHLLELYVANAYANVETYLSTFSKADEIIGAQFYYTNPLMYILIDAEDCADYAQLYADYFLIPPRFYDAIGMDFEVFAVNDEFIKQFGSFSQHTQERVPLKELNDEFTDKAADQGNHDILDNLFFRYQEKGLYVIGIRKKQGEHQRALPAKLETTS